MLGAGSELQFQAGMLLAGRYEVVRFLGAGGMGSVVLVRDRSLQNTELVLKFLHSSLALDEQQFLRFQNEALLMRGLNHPHIVRTYDFGNINNLFFLSMEYVPGMTLGQLIRDCPQGLDYKRALEILYQIAIALAFAHTKGIVHRDLKPDNILIDEDGEVKLTDFGLGKAISADLSLTDTGQAVGTPHYMAPEQLRGERADQRTDMYAFGLVAYELFTGQRAFTADTYLALAQKHLSERVPLFATKQSGLPRWLQDFVEKCSAKNANSRFANFGEVAEVISSHVPATKRSLAFEPQVFSPSSRPGNWLLYWRWRKPKRVASIAIILALLTVFNVTIVVGRNNQQVRRVYAPLILRLQHTTGFDNGTMRAVLLGSEYRHVNLSRESISYSIEKNWVHVLQMQLEAGGNANTVLDSGHSAVQYAVLRHHGALIPHLAKAGADFTVEDDKRRNLPMLAALTGRAELLAMVLTYFSRVNGNIDARDVDGKTALHYAIERGGVASVELLLREGASVHLFDNTGTSPLMYAALVGNGEIIERILVKAGGANINQTNDEGYTALHFASFSGSAEGIELLLRYGADPTLMTRGGQTARSLASEKQHAAVLAVFDARGITQ